MSLTGSERQARARIGGYARAARYDGSSVVASARAAFDQRFVDEVLQRAAECGEELSEKEVERRAQLALKAHMSRLAYRSIKARARRRRAEAREP